MTENYAERPVLVTGVPRSGTSIVMGALAVCGLWVGRTVPGDPRNPKGYFENIHLRERVNKQILRRLGCDPLGVRCLPDLGNLPAVTNLRDSALSAIAAEGYDGARPWGFKEPKLTLIWPLWRQHFPAARWVVVRRDRDETVQSCLRTSFMAQHSRDPGFWHTFIEAYDERLDALVASGVWCREIDSADVVAGNTGALAALAGEIGLTYNPRGVAEYVSPDIWKRSEYSGSAG